MFPYGPHGAGVTGPRRHEIEMTTLFFSFPRAGNEMSLRTLEALMIVSARRLVDRVWETREGELLHWPEPAREAIGHLAA